MNSLRNSAFTAELRENSVVIPQVVTGSVKGTKNVLKHVGMLEGPIEKITEFPIPTPKEQLRRSYNPRLKHSGVIRFLVNPGDKVKKGQSIAIITDIVGRKLGDGYIRTDYDGYMVGLRSEMTVYPNNYIAEMGIKDDTPLLAEIPPKKKS